MDEQAPGPTGRSVVMPDALVNRLREWRGEFGRTQAKLAGRVGVSRKTINAIENEIFVPSTLLALKLARALGSRSGRSSRSKRWSQGR